MEFKPWYYLQESVDLEVLLTEGFKEKKQQFLTQGATREEIDEYFPIFQKIQKTPYKSISDIVPGLTVAAPNRKNIDMYPNFDQLKIFVDYMRSREDLEDKVFTDIQTTGKPVFENNILEVSYADSPQACIAYKGDLPYSWCVSRKTENVYYSYRLKATEPSFYFVKNKIRTEKELSSWKPEDFQKKISWKDPWHFFVVQVLINANLDDQDAEQYIVTSANNDGDKSMSWENLLQIEPSLRGLQQLFKPVALPPEDRAFIQRWQNGATDEEFDRMTYREKSKFMSVYVRLGRGLTDNQFASLPPSLWNEYLNFSVGLTDKQFEMIKDKRELVRRYTELSIKKFNDLVESKISFSYLKPSEWEVLKNHGESLDWDRMSDFFVSESFYDASDKQTMSDLMTKHKKDLSQQNIYAILFHTPDLSRIEEKLGPEKLEIINGFEEDKMVSLIDYADDKQRVCDLILNYKKELKENELYSILRNSSDISVVEKKLKPKDIKKITDLLNDPDYYHIHDLIQSGEDKQGVSDLIAKHKKNFELRELYAILRYTPDLSRIEQNLGPENLKMINLFNKLYLSDLFSGAVDRKSMANLLVKYKDGLNPENIHAVLG